MVTALSAFMLTLILILILENVQQYLPVSKDLLKSLKTKSDFNNKDKLPKDKEKPEPPGDPPPRAMANPVHQPRPFEQESRDREKEKKVPEKRNEIEETESRPPKNDTIKTETTETTEKRDNQMERYFANMNILKLLFKWKIHLGIIVLVAVVLAAIFSSSVFITPMFKSWAIVYPSNVQPYSEESESEQMLQYFQSREIRDKIISKYNLAKRYKIDPSYKYFQTAMLGEYSKNISVSKTPYESIRIDVMDSDPQIACDIANDIINFYNLKVLKTHRQKYEEVVVILADRLEKKRLEIDEVEKKHYQLRTEYGLIDYPNQSREVARGFLGTVDGNNAQHVNIKEVLKLKKNLEEKGGEFIFYNDRYFDIVEEYGRIKMDYENALMNYEREISYASVVSEPFPSDKKSYPVRWVILAITAIATLFFAFILILIIENFQSIRRKF